MQGGKKVHVWKTCCAQVKRTLGTQCCEDYTAFCNRDISITNIWEVLLVRWHKVGSFRSFPLYSTEFSKSLSLVSHRSSCELQAWHTDLHPQQDYIRSQVGREEKDAVQCTVFLIKVVGKNNKGCLMLPASFKQCVLWLLASLTALFSSDYPKDPPSKRQRWRLKSLPSNPSADLMRDNGQNEPREVK